MYYAHATHLVCGHLIFFKRGRSIFARIGGAVYGYLSGFVGIGGPLRGALLLGYGLEKEEYIATSGAISLLIDLTRVPAYLFSGYLSSQYYIMIPFMLIVALAGSSASKILLNRLQPKVFSSIIQMAILIMGVKILLGTLT